MILSFDGSLVDAHAATGFPVAYAHLLAGATYVDGQLRLPDPAWRVAFLGRGEEKAVYLARDPDGAAYALELIDERSYLNGRFITGTYFAQLRVPGLAGVPYDGRSPFGLRFTGLMKVRDYVAGYEWARFQWRPDRRSWLDRPLTGWLRLILGGRYERYRRHYKDVHERNVLFEVRPWAGRGVLTLARDHAGRIRLVRVALQPVDLR